MKDSLRHVAHDATARTRVVVAALSWLIGVGLLAGGAPVGAVLAVLLIGCVAYAAIHRPPAGPPPAPRRAPFVVVSAAPGKHRR